MLNLASAELNGSPLWYFTPERSLKVQVVGAVSFHSVASPGCSLPSGWRLVRLSNRLNDQRMSFDDVLKCGSRRARSPPWATISSFFWVVWAAAVPPRAGDSAAAAPSAAVDFRRSRLVNWLIGSPWSGPA